MEERVKTLWEKEKMLLTNIQFSSFLAMFSAHLKSLSSFEPILSLLSADVLNVKEMLNFLFGEELNSFISRYVLQEEVDYEDIDWWSKYYASIGDNEKCLKYIEKGLDMITVSFI